MVWRLTRLDSIRNVNIKSQMGINVDINRNDRGKGIKLV